MRKAFYYISLALLPAFSYSQKKLTDEDAPGLKYSCLPLKFTTKINTINTRLPVDKLELIDARADTTKIGFFYNNAALKMMKLCFENGMKEETGNFLDHYLQNNFTASSNSLVVSIRKLWVGRYDTLVKDKSSFKIQMIFLKAEFYIKESACYYPLYRFDSSIIFKSGNNEIVAEIIQDILIASLRKALNYDYGKIKTLSCINRSSLDSFNLVRSSFVVSNTQPAKGVYLKLDQFRNNKPAYTDFEIRRDVASDQIYVKDKKGIDSLIGNAWGYSDGKRAYCRVGYNYFPLFKCGGNFDLYAPKNFIQQNPLVFYYNPMPGTDAPAVTAGLAGLATAELLSMIKTTSVKLKPMQLDLESGKFY